jgi:hypothetical protein
LDGEEEKGKLCTRRLRIVRKTSRPNGIDLTIKEEERVLCLFSIVGQSDRNLLVVFLDLLA